MVQTRKSHVVFRDEDSGPEECRSPHEEAAVCDRLIERFLDCQGAFPDSESEGRSVNAERFGSSVTACYEQHAFFT
jgi:hypothetical protein